MDESVLIVNAGVVQAHEQGILTSASLMVRWPAAAEAASYASSSSRLSLGLHVDLGEWVLRDGTWEPVYEVVPLERTELVEAEVKAQIESFQRMTGRNPTHLDSHQHIHNWETTVRVFTQFARELGVPLRHHTNAIAYCGFLYGQASDGEPIPGVTVERLIEIIAGLPAGVTELACHPGLGEDSGSVYDRERAREVEILCDPRVREVLQREGVALRSFADIQSSDHT